MDDNEAGDATSHYGRGKYEGAAQRTGGVKTPVAAEGHDDISLERWGLPARETAPDFGDHGDFKQAAAGSAQKTARSKELSEHEYGHSNLAAIRRMLQRSGSTGVGVFLLSNVTRIVY